MRLTTGLRISLKRSLDLSVSLLLMLLKLLNETEMFHGSNTEYKPKAKSLLIQESVLSSLPGKLTGTHEAQLQVLSITSKSELFGVYRSSVEHCSSSCLKDKIYFCFISRQCRGLDIQIQVFCL